MARNTAKTSGGRRKSAAGKTRKEAPGKPDSGALVPGEREEQPSADLQPRRNGGWREIEALREKAALKASLADVWDEDFDLDEEILAELDHTAEFFTTQAEDPEAEIFEEDVEEEDFFDEDEEV